MTRVWRLVHGGWEFLLLLFQRRGLIWEMAKRDVAQRYAGSLLGMVWTLVHPLALLAIFWFVFGYGLRSKPVADVPFAVWLVAGLAPWFFFAEIVAESTVSITANPHLIKKVLFPAQILPVVKIVAALCNHGVFLALLAVLMLANGLPLRPMALQSAYYALALVVLGLSLSWLTSALNVFVRDVAQLVQLGLQILFWATPILWDLAIMPEPVQLWLRLNPMHYVVQGYRDSFLLGRPAWDHPVEGLWFWGLALVLFAVGGAVFRKLKPHFADVI